MSELVSVIIPVYNMEKSLEKSIQSILKQTYKNLEIILVNDGSVDNTFEICEKISTRDKRVKCFHTVNQGSGPARNVGILNSKGKYIYFPDADDYVAPDAIFDFMYYMKKSDCDLIVFGYRNMTHSNQIISEKTYKNFENSGFNIRKDYSDYFGMDREYSIQGAPWNKFFDGDIIRKNKIEFPSLRRHQDEGFISRYVSYCQKVRFIPVSYTHLTLPTTSRV